MKSYTIDDSNYECWRVIVADCPNSHRYASLCELIADCPSVKQITKDCVINALNNLTSLAPSWLDASKWFLRVKTDWCLEIADPKISTQDKYVVVSEGDNNPWPLDTKVKWSCSYDGLYCIDIEEAWPQTLVWRPSGPNGPFVNPSMPTSECAADDGMWYNVRLRKDWDAWKVDYSCPKVNDYPQYCKCIYTWGTSNTPCIKWKDSSWTVLPVSERVQRTVRYFLPTASHYWEAEIQDDMQSQDNANSYIRWNWNINWTEAFAAPNSYWVVMIKMPWIYEISFSTYIIWYQRWHSIRCWLYMKDGNWNVRELNDIKYQCWEYPGLNGISTTKPALNRMFPDTFDPDVWNHYTNTWWTLDNTWLPFSRTYIINITRDTELYMAVKPDMRDEDPRIDKSYDSEWNYHIHVTWQNDNEYSAATSIEITRLWDAVPESRMININ